MLLMHIFFQGFVIRIKKVAASSTLKSLLDGKCLLLENSDSDLSKSLSSSKIPSERCKIVTAINTTSKCIRKCTCCGNCSVSSFKFLGNPTEYSNIECHQLCNCPQCSLIKQCSRDLAFLNHLAYSRFGSGLVKPGRLVRLSCKHIQAIKHQLLHSRDGE